MSSTRFAAFICVAAGISIDCSAQQPLQNTVWAFAGMEYRSSASVRIIAQAGYSPDQQIRAVYTQGFIKINESITLNPAYLYLAATGYSEHGLMNGLTFAHKMRTVLLDNRNLLWTRFISGAGTNYIYRNRLRLTRPFSFRKRDAKAYIFNEASYFFNFGKWTRNRVGVGFAIEPFPGFNLEVFYARQSDTFAGNGNLFFFSQSFRLK